MSLDLSRRKFLIGLGLVGVAPAIVKAENIMRVREYKFSMDQIYDLRFDTPAQGFSIQQGDLVQINDRTFGVQFVVVGPVEVNGVFYTAKGDTIFYHTDRAQSLLMAQQAPDL